ncbi:hypothetical protein QR680_013032 [Steinernema hermaphroditum]|uniref:Tudor domain-containing protein n=1 Tax=Steinernema hermaphroditum TaxID=289476 RepID=A0AA39I5S1_9BILA|nr:hypothetical protein QR680_013032 [Steinernema hermaphroditum]
MTTLSVVRDCSGGSAPRALEVDTSDEMEEIRELLYGLINEEFPAGVRSDFLQKTYEKKYSDVALGPKLPSNWLEQIEHSEEFELQRRGHLILVYTRQRDLPEPIDVTQIVTPLKATALNLSASHAKTTIASSQACKLYKASVTSFGAATLCTIAWASDAFDKFAISPREDILHGVWNLKVAMKEHFSDGSIDEASADAVPQPGNLYAVKEKDFWYRVEVLSIVGAEFAMVFFVDRGAVARVGQKEVLPLNAKFTDAVKWPAFFLPSMLSMSARLESKFVDSCRGAISSGDGAKCEVRFMRFDDASRRFLVDLVEDSLVVVEKRPDSGASRHSDSAVDDRKNSTVSLSSAPPRSSSAGGTALPAFEPLVAKEMVTGRPFAVSILYMEDPDNISVRPCSLDPIPEYMYNSLSRDWETLPPLAESDVIGGSLYIAKTKHGFERVRAVRSEEGLWRVFAIDIGAYEEVAVADLKALTTVGSFMKVMMLKCRLDGLIPNSPEEKWPDNSRTVLADIARSAKKVQLVPVGEWAKWSCEDSLIPVPYVTCRLEVDNVDVSRLLVDRGVALQR